MRWNHPDTIAAGISSQVQHQRSKVSPEHLNVGTYHPYEICFIVNATFLENFYSKRECIPTAADSTGISYTMVRVTLCVRSVVGACASDPVYQLQHCNNRPRPVY